MTISLVIDAVVRGQQTVDRLNRSVTELGVTSVRSSRAFRLLGAALAGVSFAVVAREAARASDAIRSLNAQLVTTGSSAGLAARQVGTVAQIAQQTGSNFDTVADVFARLQRSSRDFGANTREIAINATAIQQSYRLSGANAAAAAGSTIQLGQALSFGVLMAEELNSILENNDVLAGSIRDFLDKSNQELRALASTGKLEASVVFQAILADAENINEQFQNFGNLYEQSFIRIQNASRLVVGELGTVFDEVTGINQIVADFTQIVTDAFESGRLRLAIIRFVIFVDDSFSRIRQFIDDAFGKLGIEISDELNLGLALFAIAAAPKAAFAAAGVALKLAFSLALGAVSIIKDFVSDLVSQIGKSDLKPDGQALGKTLRLGFEDTTLTPQIEGPRTSDVLLIGQTARDDVIRGFGTVDLAANVVRPPTSDLELLGSNVKSDLVNGFGNGNLNAQIITPRSDDIIAIGENTRGRLDQGFGDGVFTTYVEAPIANDVMNIGKMARLNLDQGYGDGALTSFVRSDENAMSVGDTNRMNLISGFGDGVLSTSVLAPPDTALVGMNAFNSVSDGFGTGILTTSIEPPEADRATNIGQTAMTNLFSGFGNGVLTTSIIAPTDARVIGSTTRDSFYAGFGNGELITSVVPPTDAEALGSTTYNNLSSGFGDGVLTATILAPEDPNGIGTTAMESLRAGFGDGNLNTTIIAPTDGTTIGETADADFRRGFGDGVLTSSLIGPEAPNLVGMSANDLLREGFGTGILEATVTSPPDVDVMMVGQNIRDNLRAGFGDGVLQPVIAEPIQQDNSGANTDSSGNIDLSGTSGEGTSGGGGSTGGSRINIESAGSLGAGAGIFRRLATEASERAASIVATGGAVRTTATLVMSGVAGAVSGIAGVLGAREANEALGIDNDSVLGTTTQVAGGVGVGIIGEQAVNSAIRSNIFMAVQRAIAALFVGGSAVSAGGGTLVIGGLTLFDFITQQIQFGIDNSSATSGNTLANARAFDRDYARFDQTDIDTEAQRLADQQQIFATNLQEILEQFPDVDEAALKVATSEIRGSLVRLGQRTAALERAQAILNGEIEFIPAGPGIIGNFATGGSISGSGSGTSDSILAMVSNGEFIVNAQSAAQYLPLLEAINDGSIPRYNQGGIFGGIRRALTGGGATDTTEEVEPSPAVIAILKDIQEASEVLAEAQALLLTETEEGIIEGVKGQEQNYASSVRSVILLESLETTQKATLAALEEQLAQQQDRDSSGILGDIAELFDFDFGPITMMLQQTLTQELGDALRSGDFSDIGDALLTSFSNSIIDSFAANVSESIFGALNSALTSDTFAALGATISSSISSVLSSIDFNEVFAILRAFIGFNQGGVVPNTTTSTPGVDSVPALLTPGETVIPVGGSLPNSMGQTNNISVNLEVVGDVSAATRREILQMLPEIIDSTQATFQERRIINA